MSLRRLLHSFVPILEGIWHGRGAHIPFARYPRLSALLGLLLVAALVPVLRFWHGADGPLGQSIPLIFLVPVLLASATGGLGTGALVSCAAIVTWDWFFIPPLYTLTIASVRDVLALVVFLLVALLTGELATLARHRAEDAQRLARGSEALYDLSLALIAGRDLNEVLPGLIDRLRETFQLEAVAVLLPGEDGTWRTAAQAGRLPAELHVEESRSLATTAGRVYAQGEECRLGHMVADAGASARVRRPRPGHERARLLPLHVGTRAIGVLELLPKGGEKPSTEREHLLTTFANGAALALEQARLAREEREAAVARESDRLKSALLSSVSHDLRTPLAGIKAAASSLLQRDIEWGEADRIAFLTDIDQEADRLSRLVSNLLDVSRIEAGAIKPAKEWEDVGELIERVARRMAPRLPDHPLLQEVSESLPPVLLDAVQIEQVLTNLLENAAKYSAAGTPIAVRARVVGDAPGPQTLEVAVADRGVGIPREEQGRIFDKFYRVVAGSRGISGTGMGLAIVKGLVEAHGGQAIVESMPGHGSTFTIRLPIERKAPLVPATVIPAAGRAP